MDETVIQLEEKSQGFVIVDPSDLQPATLRRLAKEFILRECHDAGIAPDDAELEVDAVIARLKKRECLITFDRETETVGVMLASEFRAHGL
jgi:uncharacterized protein YheU (UPF0270 family)